MNPKDKKYLQNWRIHIDKVCKQQDWSDEINSGGTLQKKHQHQRIESGEVQKKGALGVVWNIKTDTFGFKISLKDKPTTKRVCYPN